MIKIFSIKEIVDASEELLKSQNQKIDKNLDLNNKQKKISNASKTFEKPLVLENELENTTNEPEVEHEDQEDPVTTERDDEEFEDFVRQVLHCIFLNLWLI